MRLSLAAFCVIGLVAPAAGCGSDATSDGGGQTATPQALPMTVSDYFAPSGYMGDGAASTTAILMDTTACLVPRPSGAVGDCYKVTYTPGSTGWAGVYWQYPANNWGAKPGKIVEAGATKVTFQAAGGSGGEVVNFVAGGVNDATMSHHDSLKVTHQETLTTALTAYQIDISGQTYDSGVLGAFAWSAAPPSGSMAPIVFYLDAIQWEK